MTVHDEQLGLFANDCEYPQLDAASSYRYGCRCQRCRIAKQRARPVPARCAHDGCAALREKYYRWCAEHIPPPTTRNTTARRRKEAPCLLCSRPHGWYESVLALNVRAEVQDLYRMTCEGCRKRYIGVIKVHHLDTATAMRLLTIDRCELCDKPFAIGSNGRKHAVIDHDHACCPGSASCGWCVRGLVCQRCNQIIGSVESVTVELDKVVEYLRRHGQTR